MAGVTADSTLWTADSICWTADGRIICIAADVAEAAAALDIADAVSRVSANAIEAAAATAVLDAVSVVSAISIEPAGALDQIDAAVGANVLFGTVAEAANALDQFAASVVGEVVEVPGTGVGYYPQPLRPTPVVGIGYGILPQLEGEAHGVVGVVAAGSVALPDVAAEVAASVGVAGRSEAKLLVRATAIGACGARGAGAGMIMKFSGSATGQQDDDEAAVIAFLLAA